MAFEVLTSFTSWWQNLSLLLRQEITLPSLFDIPRKYLLSILSLELNGIPLIDLLAEVKDYTRVDYRVQFILLNIVFPLFATFMTMLLFRNFWILMWYFILLLGISLIFASLIGLLLPRSSFSSAIYTVNLFGSYLSAEIVTLIVGVVLIVASILLALVWILFKMLKFFWKKYKRRKRVNSMNSALPENAIQKSAEEELEDRMEDLEYRFARGSGETEDTAPEQDTRSGNLRTSTKSSPERMQQAGSTVAIQVRPRNSPHTPASEVAIRRKLNRMSTISQAFFDVFRNDPNVTAESMKRKKKKALKPRPVVVIRNFLIALVLLLLGLFLVQALKATYFGLDDSNAWDNFVTGATWGVVCLVLGILLLTFSTFFILLGCINCWKVGRRFSYNFMHFLKLNLLKLLFLLIAILYTPMITSIFSSFVCKDVTCPVESRHLVRYNTFSLSTLFRGNDSSACEACTWHENNYCPTNLSTLICPGAVDNRLYIDPTLSCYNDIAWFFWPPAILLGVAFGLGLPFLYCSLTRLSVKYFKEFDVDVLMKKNMCMEITNPKKALKRQQSQEEDGRSSPSLIYESSRKEGHSKDTDGLFSFTDTKSPSPPPQEIPADNQKNISPASSPGDDAELLGDQNSKENAEMNIPRYLSRLKKLREKSYTQWLRDLCRTLSPQHLKKTLFSPHRMERWRLCTALTNNPVRSLYYHYEYRWHQFSLYNLVYKMLLVGVSVVLISWPTASVSLSFSFHLVNGVVILISRPYILLGEDIFALLVAILSMINAIFMFIAYFVELGNWSFWVMLALNAIIPCAAVILVSMHLFRGIRANQLYSRRLKKISTACQDPEDHREGIEKLREFIQKDLREKYKLNIRKKYRNDYRFVERYMNRLKSNHQDVDTSLTHVTLKWVLYFFILLGICCFISLIFTTIGLLYGELNPWAVPSSVKSQPTTCADRYRMEFVGYDNWSNFTSNCCCAEGNYYSGSLFESKYKQVEIWSCINGERKERVRVMTQNSDTYSGLGIRSFCNKTFTEGYGISSCSGGDMKLNTPSGSQANSFELQYLW